MGRAGWGREDVGNGEIVSCRSNVACVKQYAGECWVVKPHPTDRKIIQLVSEPVECSVSLKVNRLELGELSVRNWLYIPFGGLPTIDMIDA